MRIVRLTLNGPGNTQPIMVNYMQPNFNVAVGVMPSAALVTAATLSCSAQYTMDDQSVKRQVNWSQAGNTVTITDGIQPFGSGAASLATAQNPHGLVTGDSVSIDGTGAGQAAGFVSFDGNYNVTVTSPTQYTITVTPAQTVASADGRVIPQRWVTSTAVPLATAARLFANIIQPFSALRFVVAAATVPSVDFIVIQGLD
jgi:hypothetical protein